MPIQFKFIVDVFIKLFWIKDIISFWYLLICYHSSKLLIKYLFVTCNILPYFYVGFVVWGVNEVIFNVSLIESFYNGSVVQLKRFLCCSVCDFKFVTCFTVVLDISILLAGKTQ